MSRETLHKQLPKLFLSTDLDHNLILGTRHYVRISSTRALTILSQKVCFKVSTSNWYSDFIYNNRKGSQVGFWGRSETINLNVCQVSWKKTGYIKKKRETEGSDDRSIWQVANVLVRLVVAHRRALGWDTLLHFGFLPANTYHGQIRVFLGGNTSSFCLHCAHTGGERSTRVQSIRFYLELCES